MSSSTAAAGAALAGLFAVLVLGLLANQVATGLALTLFGLGLSALIGQGYIGVRPDVGDTRFRDFLNWWCEWNVLLGHNEAKLKAALNERGITDIPDHVRF